MTYYRQNHAPKNITPLMNPQQKISATVVLDIDFFMGTMAALQHYHASLTNDKIAESSSGEHSPICAAIFCNNETSDNWSRDERSLDLLVHTIYISLNAEYRGFTGSRSAMKVAIQTLPSNMRSVVNRC